MDETTKATLEHIHKVQMILADFRIMLHHRGNIHDQSKLAEPELSLFAEWSPKLSAMKYGSEEYKEALTHMGPALDHHYENNRHHPEHFPNGIWDMNLFDLLEMMADWKASQERVKGGNMEQSLEINKKRFDISIPLVIVLTNTARDLGWLNNED